jgi:hypothetical protein
MIVCCNAAGQFLTLFYYQSTLKRKEFRWWIIPTVRYMTRRSSYISMDLLFKWFTEHFHKHEALGKVIPHLDDHRSHCNPPSLLQIALENNVTVIRLASHCTHTLQPLDKWFFGAWKSYFKNEPQLVKSLDIAWRVSFSLLAVRLLSWMLV